jgi:lipopolysaccharide heptosyltransferase I
MLSLRGDEARKILIVRTSALGDVVHALPSLSALRRLFPAASISWIVEPAGAGLLAGHPELDRVIELPRSRWKRDLGSPLCWPRVAAEVLSTWRALRRERFDLVLDFHSSLRSAWILLMSGGRHRVGFHRRDAAEAGGTLLATHTAPRAPPRASKVEKNLLLVRELGYRGECPRGTIRVPDEDRAWARALVSTLPGSGPVVAVHPCVSRFGEIKRWPAERYRALIDLLRGRLDARILITWGPGERPAAEAVERPTLVPSDVKVSRFAALLAAADLVVAADTGALPIAAMLGTPSVGIFGPKDPVVYAPHPVRGEIVASTAPCSPCRLRACEHRICMTLIPPEAVFAAAERALAGGRTPEPARHEG